MKKSLFVGVLVALLVSASIAEAGPIARILGRIGGRGNSCGSAKTSQTCGGGTCSPQFTQTVQGQPQSQYAQPTCANGTCTVPARGR